MRARLWPTGLIGRVGIVLFAAVVLELIGSAFVFEQAELVTSDEAQARRVAEQIDAAAHVLTATRPADRPSVVEAMRQQDLPLTWTADLQRPHWPPSDPRTGALRARMLDYEPELASRQLALKTDDKDDHAVVGRLDLTDGTTLGFRIASIGSVLPNLYGQVGSIVILSGCVLLAALLLVRTLAAPLKMLVKATDAIGHGPSIQLDDAGPREVRRVARAFNAMQERIARLLADRTQALAAVSHDLRTPIARMRLRSGFLKQPEDQAAFEADLGEMEAMLNALLAYLGGETDSEKPKRTDLAALLTTLVDAATDAGRDARYDGPDHLTLTVRSLALKRAFSNILNNALIYGDAARVSLRDEEASVSIHVEDDGPGIAEDELARVFEPFYRIDASRSRSTGGMGLGLAITLDAVKRENGRITLSNRPAGGLTVTIALPKSVS